MPHGVAGLMRALAAALGRKGVTVNAICPGFFLTEANQHCRTLRPCPEHRSAARLAGEAQDASNSSSRGTTSYRQSPRAGSNTGSLAHPLVSKTPAQTPARVCPSPPLAATSPTNPDAADWPRPSALALRLPVPRATD